MNRRQQAKAQPRARVIAAAQQVWAEPGSYEDGTIRVIATAAGMSTGSIFANFEGKEDLWRVAMGYEPPIDSAAVRAALRAAAPRPVLAEAA
jgi:AcrR family transcriptional regulator